MIANENAAPRRTPVERALRRARLARAAGMSAVILLASVLVWAAFVRSVPEEFARIDDHFKYGSIGADVDNGIPYWVWRVMPAMCGDHLAARGDDASADYSAFGFVVEPGRDRPIGFSKRRADGIELVGLNCAVCHTGTVRATPDAEPQIVLGMPAHQLDLLSYFEFLFDCAGDERFSVDGVMAYIDAATSLPPVERAVYRAAIPKVREALLSRAGRLAPLRTERFRSGKGRIDTFNPYKAVVLRFPEMARAWPGSADFPSIWNQGVRRDLPLHWDGNNDSLFERNISAAIGAGVTPESLDLPAVERVAAWLQDVSAPRYPLPISVPPDAIAAGKSVYVQYCRGCHGQPETGWRADGVGKVEPLAEIGTDPNRLLSYTYEFVASQWTIGSGHDWRFKHFRKTDGYVNMPLDGLWARSPYLHNGSVPTLRDLLASPKGESEEERAAREREVASGDESRIEAAVAKSVRDARARGERPPIFYAGDDRLDDANVGFVADRARSGRRRNELYDTTRETRHNGGHSYGTALAAADKELLLAFLKTL